jgi:isopenicillin N synthase-like dioxygenase
MGDLDLSFIQDLENRPNVKVIEPEEVPVIDFFTSSHGDTKEIVSEIGNACRKWGFFQVINHGVPLELSKRMVKMAKEFFDQPIEEKKKVKRDEGNSMGYHDREHTKNVRDWKEVFDFSLEDPRLVPAMDNLDDQELRTISNRWPQYPTEFR